MGAFDDRPPPPRGPLQGAPGGANWDDWDPLSARRGYTEHMGALRGFSAPARNPIDLPEPTLARVPSGESPPLSPAALALSARADTEDYLTVTYDVREPGFAELYEALIQPQWSVPFGRLLLSVFLTLPRDTGWQGLDVACGAGYPTLELARHTGQDCDIAGIDIWEDAILLARRKASESWLRNVTFLVADIMRSGLPENSFDTITCNLGLTSFSDRAGALRAMWRLARPRGRVLITTPTQAAMREFLDTYYLTLRDLKLGDYQRAFGQQVAMRPTSDGVRTLMERVGFQVERVVTDTFTLRFPTPQAFLRSPLIQTTFMAGWRGIISDVTVRRLVFNEVERRLEARAAANGGELTMTAPMVCVVGARV
ncbi:MAG TPA: methyltransferase domain-containing protein [Ktedonobacterales bacterium]|nr:methyltransferase domain-containing protein [Ktedonobacterales bacterium]